MIDFDNTTDLNIDIRDLERIRVCVCPSKSLELIVADDENIREINRKYRGLDKSTDVLSFPIKLSPANFIGSIVISIDAVSRVSKELGVAFEAELKLLFIHGLLHLLGYDHEIDNGEMRKEERRIADLFGAQNPLLDRGD